MDNRTKYNKYIIGNILYLIVAFFIGSVFYAFIYDSMNTSVYSSKSLFTSIMSILGFSLILFGTLTTLYKRFNISTSFAEFIYLVMIFFIASYLLKFLSIIDNSFSYPIMILSTLFSSYILMIMMGLWKRKSGFSVFLFFSIGIGTSSLIFSIYNYDITHIYLVRTAICFLFIFILFYIFGFFGIVKSRRLYLFISALVVMILSFYPLNPTSTIKELNKYYWMNSFIDSNNSEYLTTKKTSSGKFDYFFHRDYSKEYYFTAYNSNILEFYYPFDYEQEEFLLVNFLQAKSFDNVLIIGQAPLAFFEFLSNRINLKKDSVTLTPINKDYYRSSSKIFNVDINNFATVSEPNNEKYYDSIFIFPQADSTTSVTSKYSSYLNSLKNVSNINVVLFNDLGAINIIKKLKNKFSLVSKINEPNLDLSFYILTNDRSTVSLDSDFLKKKFIELSTDDDYLYFKSSLESNPYEILNQSINDYVKYDNFTYKTLFTIIISAILFFIFVVFSNITNKKDKFKNSWAYFYLAFIPISMFFVLSNFFFHSLNFYKLFSFQFSIFIFALILGFICIYKYKIPKSKFMKIIYVSILILFSTMTYFYSLHILYYITMFLIGFLVIFNQKERLLSSFLVEYLTVILGIGILSSIILYVFLGYFYYSIIIFVLFFLYIAHLLSLKELKE